jgi:hypothetical protein
VCSYAVADDDAEPPEKVFGEPCVVPTYICVWRNADGICDRTSDCIGEKPPADGQESELICPECNTAMPFVIHDGIWRCNGCGEAMPVDDVFNCSQCNADIPENDYYFQANGSLWCPDCESKEPNLEFETRPVDDSATVASRNIPDVFEEFPDCAGDTIFEDAEEPEQSRVIAYCCPREKRVPHGDLIYNTATDRYSCSKCSGFFAGDDIRAGEFERAEPVDDKDGSQLVVESKPRLNDDERDIFERLTSAQRGIIAKLTVDPTATLQTLNHALYNQGIIRVIEVAPNMKELYALSSRGMRMSWHLEEAELGRAKAKHDKAQAKRKGENAAAQQKAQGH